jgi:hypothetical protein
VTDVPFTREDLKETDSFSRDTSKDSFRSSVNASYLPGPVLISRDWKQTVRANDGFVVLKILSLEHGSEEVFGRLVLSQYGIR